MEGLWGPKTGYWWWGQGKSNDPVCSGHTPLHPQTAADNKQRPAHYTGLHMGQDFGTGPGATYLVGGHLYLLKCLDSPGIAL